MIASGLIESQFYYAVFVLAAGALAIANVDATTFQFRRASSALPTKTRRGLKKTLIHLCAPELGVNHDEVLVRVWLRA
jgi:hypothetical protein